MGTCAQFHRHSGCSRQQDLSYGVKRTAISVCLLTQIFIAVAFWLLLIDANATTTVAVNAFTTGSRTVLPIQERA